MSDSFGIHASQVMALHLYENASRSSGRTTMLVNLVRPGDAIVVPTETIGRTYVSKVRERGIKAQIGLTGHTAETIAMLVINPKSDHLEKYRPNQHGEAHLSHEYAHAIMEDAILRAARQMDAVKRDLSWTPKTAKGQIMDGQVNTRFGWNDYGTR